MRCHAVVLAALAWLISAECAEARLEILVDKGSQRMMVMEDGYVRYLWPVSTGPDQMATPSGEYVPQRLERNWFSREYYDSPMPFAIFFHNGYAIHGSYAIDKLGGPASHGCVRLHPHHAQILFDLVQQEGPGNTVIEVADQARPDIASALPREMPPQDIAARDVIMPRDVPPGVIPAREFIPPRDVPMQEMPPRRMPLRDASMRDMPPRGIPLRDLPPREVLP